MEKTKRLAMAVFGLADLHFQREDTPFLRLSEQHLRFSEAPPRSARAAKLPAQAALRDNRTTKFAFQAIFPWGEENDLAHLGEMHASHAETNVKCSLTLGANRQEFCNRVETASDLPVEG